MFSGADTIVAVATPPGHGGIGVVRISGPDAPRIACALIDGETLPPRQAVLARLSAGRRHIDEVVVTFFPAPRSYTTEDVVEISGHGSPVLMRSIVRAAMAGGARLAEPGEFTLRAFLGGRIDLVQAEAVADLVNAVTPLQARAAFDQLQGTLTARLARVNGAIFDLCAVLEASLDFPEEAYHFVQPAEAVDRIAGLVDDLDALLADSTRGRVLREGAHVVITGRPNVGKSSLFNTLCGADRAIVTAVPGTTRDLLSEVVDLQGIPVTLVDTAGLREAVSDAAEAEGVSRARSARDIASCIVVVLDASAPLSPGDAVLLAETSRSPRVVAANKCDLACAWGPGEAAEAGEVVAVSALTGEGLQDLEHAIVRALGGVTATETPAITNARHANLATSARAALGRALDAAAAGAPEEIVLLDLHDARASLEEITGRRNDEDLLREIFARFCIGK